MKTDRIAGILRLKPLGQQVVVAGWVRTRRDSSNFSFVEVNDGSCLANLQIIADQNLENYESQVKKLGTGCSVVVRGELKESPAQGQPPCEGSTRTVTPSGAIAITWFVNSSAISSGFSTSTVGWLTSPNSGKNAGPAWLMCSA